MTPSKSGKKKPQKAKPSPAARKPKPATKKAAKQPASPRKRAAVKRQEPVAKATREPALLTLTATGLGALRKAIDTGARRSGTRKRGAAAAKRDKSLSDALDRLSADYARLLR